MSKIIKKVLLGEDLGMGCMPCGQWLAEMIIDHDGKEVFVSASDIGEDALYFVSDHSIYTLIEDMDPASKEEASEVWEIGSVNDYSNEDEMAKSCYYDCFKYLHSIIRNDYKEPTEYTADYGKDIEKMDDLLSIAEADGYMEDDDGEWL